MEKKIILVCSPLRFYTFNDEELLFGWIKKIPCIEKCTGVGNALHCYIASSFISNDELLDLMGLFKRYKFDSAQLTIFMNETNKDWFTE